MAGVGPRPWLPWTALAPRRREAVRSPSTRSVPLAPQNIASRATARWVGERAGPRPSGVVDRPPPSDRVSHLMRAGVLWERGEPLSIEEIELLPLEPHDVHVRMAASGVCHSDLSYVQG